VELFGDGAFFQCHELETVTFGAESHLKKILGFRFSGLKEIRLPDNCEEVASEAFQACQKLMKIEFGVNSKLRQFRGLTDSPIQFLELPASCEVIVRHALENCDRLQALMFAEGSKLGEFRRKIPNQGECCNQRKFGLDSRIRSWVRIGGRSIFS